MATNFSDIDFNAQFHTYTHRPTGRQLVSVTKKIGEIKPPFDAPAVAAKVVAKKGGTVQALLAEWDAARAAGQAKGERVHTYIESVLRGAEPQTGDPFLALNQPQPEIVAFDTLWAKLRGSVEVKWVEWIIGDIDLGIAGTCDTVLYNPETDSLHIWDWKTGKKFETSNPWEQMKPPFGGYANCEIVIYSLQISLYRLIVERNTDLALGDSYLVYLSPAGYHEIHKALDLRAELARWLGVA